MPNEQHDTTQKPTSSASPQFRAARTATILLFAVSLFFPNMIWAQDASSPSEQTLFSFDDHSIPWKNNLKLTMVQAEKHPDNPVLRRGPEGAPDHGHAILYGSVLHIGGKFRMWYLGMFESAIKNGQAPGWWRPMCYAESVDGINWIKPELNLVEFNGNKHNNICSIQSEVASLSKVNDFLSVIHEPNDPDPKRRYKCAYIAHPPFTDVRGGRSKIGPDERRWTSFVCATSADGISWKVVGDRPMNAGGERFEVSSLYKFENRYYASGQLLSPWSWRADGSNIGRVMQTYRSTNFDQWSRSKATAFARPGQLTSTPIPGQQTHMGAGIWNRSNVLVGLYGLWQDGPKEKPAGSSHLWGTHIDLGLIVSNDGIHFREPVPDHKVITRGGDNEWDNVALLQGHAFANVDEKTMMWYSHWDTSGKLRNMEIGLATLRRDGFGYLSRQTPNSPAHFVTAAIGTNNSQKSKTVKLFVNVDEVSRQAPLMVELLDNLDQPIPSYSGDMAATIETSGTRQEVIWPATKSSKIENNGPYSVRVTLPANGDARVYAIYVGE